MTAPLVAYVAIAGQRDFDVPFPYLNPSHVEVRVNSIPIPILEWVSQVRLRLSVPPGADAYVEIRRNTPIGDALVDFQNGAVLTEEDLNTAILQLLYKQQEVTSLYEASLLAAQVRLAAANGIPVSPEDVANQLANLVLEDQVLASFQQRINDIDANSDAIALTSQDIIDLSTSVTSQVAQVAADVTAEFNVVAAEIDTLANSITDPTTGNARLKTLLDTLRSDHNTLTGVVDGLINLGNGDGIASIIQQEADARIEGDAALAALVSLIGAKNGDNSAFILDLSKVRVSPTETLATRFNTLSAADGANAASIQNEQNARTTAIAAEASQRNALNAALTTAINNEASTRAAGFISEQTARATAIAAEATARTQLAATLNGRIDGEAATRAAAITLEQSTRADEISAEAEQRELLGATLTSAIGGEATTRAAAILNEQNARTDAIAAEANARSTLGASLATAIGNETAARTAAITTEQNARATAISAEATARQTLGTTLTGLINGEAATRAAAISTVQQARIDGDAAEASARQLLGTNLTTSINGERTAREAAILTEQNARSTAIAAEATARQTLGASLTTAINGESTARAAAIQNEQTTRANAITAEAQARTTLAAALRAESDADIAAADTQIRTDVTAQIQTETNARVSALSAEATARNLVRSDLTTMVNGETTARTAAITSEANTRASADSVFANNFTLLGAKNAGSTAFVLNENTVLVAGGVSLGTRLSGIDTSVGNVSASVVNEQNARSSADTALSNSINVVSTNVGNLTASVSTLSSSLNGVSAKYGVSLNVNGHITGFVQNNDGTSGDFLILANKFAIVDPNNGNPFTPFEVSGGVVRIKEAQIGSLTIGKLSAGSLNADMNVGTGRIIFDNGIVMKVQGIGFGTSNQFIEWFGPKRAINTCAENNGTYWLKTDGSAYFGGNLSTGVLKNAVTTSATASNADVTTGSFGSNGGARTVSVGYSYSTYENITGVCPATPTMTASVNLYRGSNSSGTYLATLTVSGGSYMCTPGYGEFEPGQWSVSAGGSLTYTDNTGGLSSSYYVQLVSRDMPNGAEVTQYVSVMSVEG